MTLSGPVRSFLAEQPVGVLATVRPDGSVRQSVVYHVLDGDRILISTESKRAKSRDVIRTGRASYCVTGHVRPFPSVTVEGPARILTQGIGGPTAQLVARVTGSPPGEAPSDEALAGVDRVILELTIERAYGATHLDAPSS
ncbi:MAG: pyridoxamine 5'-phosphate oxidase family protein [Acidimicrobiales bacterium]|nr:pyridoxamine 5'-phosphate oxidase family protein [Acidimicrobiales bacterium]